MSDLYEIRIKGSALENLKRSRDEVRELLGTRQIGDRLANLSQDDAGELANRLLAFFDAVDGIVTRAKPAG